MSGSLKVGSYNPTEVSVVFGGTTLTGYADGTYIEIDYVEDAWSEVTGAHGEQARARNVNDRATVTVTLLQTSSSNDYLSTTHSADKKTGKLTLPLGIKDNNGTTTAFSSVAYVKKMPTVVYSKGIESRQWVIVASHLEENVGGSADIT